MYNHLEVDRRMSCHARVKKWGISGINYGSFQDNILRLDGCLLSERSTSQIPAVYAIAVSLCHTHTCTHQRFGGSTSRLSTPMPILLRSEDWSRACMHRSTMFRWLIAAPWCKRCQRKPQLPTQQVFWSVPHSPQFSHPFVCFHSWVSSL